MKLPVLEPRPLTGTSGGRPWQPRLKGVGEAAPKEMFAGSEAWCKLLKSLCPPFKYLFCPVPLGQFPEQLLCTDVACGAIWVIFPASGPLHNYLSRRRW